jgi:tetratricopeptide (TPR) repeat protein
MCTPVGRAIIAGLVLWACFLGRAAAQQDDPAAEMQTLIEAGDAGYLRGDYEAGRQAFEKAWQLAIETPPENPVRYDILKRLASIRAAAGEFVDADNYLQMAINWRENTLGQDDPKIADDLLVSVALCRNMKNYDRADAVLNHVLAMHVRASGFDSIAVADDFSRMAQIDLDRKELESAAGSLNAALTIRKKLAGPLDPSLVPDLDRLGEVSTTMRRYDKAEEAYRRALVIRETLYGKQHADLLATIDGLAYALFGQKKYDEAEPLYQRVIALWVWSVGPEHPMVAIVLDKVAAFYADQKKYDQAREAADRANAIRAYCLATGLSEQAAEQLKEHNKESAVALYKRALAVLDPPSPVYQELRETIEGILKLLQAPPPKTPSRKAAPPRKAE